ncbi:MAG TPA: TetR/AcrR family transcriptional regulator [Steroidobacteraceae bacterium]|nr:TetR/AcrR family transcriptional regulator [Steroidobacteraceae bacterium]
MKELGQAPEGGRTNQKARTRTAILASAIQLIREGRRPTVEEAALAAGISKRTAYRYFTSQDHMLADAALDGLRSRMNEMFAAIDASTDVHARIATLAVALCRLTQTHEAELRVMIRAALDQGSNAIGRAPAVPARGRRRLDWIEAALRPIHDQLPKGRYSSLVNSLAVCLGVDAVLVLRDVCGVAGAAAEDTMIWMANAIVDRALADQQQDA